MNKTYLPKEEQIERKSYVIDATNKILGKVAAKAAAILRGKHKVIFTPHLDTGDQVIIINAEKVKVSGKKVTDKVYSRYTGYPSGQRRLTFGQMMQKSPTKVLQLAINRMIPAGRLGNRIRRRVRIYKGDQHPHVAQKPTPLEI